MAGARACVPRALSRAVTWLYARLPLRGRKLLWSPRSVWLCALGVRVPVSPNHHVIAVYRRSFGADRGPGVTRRPS